MSAALGIVTCMCVSFISHIQLLFLGIFYLSTKKTEKQKWKFG